MKKIKKVFALLLGIFFMFSVSSCIIIQQKDHGKHLGWYKNKNNPHNPHTTKKDKNHHVKPHNKHGKGKSKGKKK